MEMQFDILTETLNGTVFTPRVSDAIELLSLSQPLDRIDTEDNIMKIFFQGVLLQGEQDQITAIVNNHDGEPYPTNIDPEPVHIVDQPAFANNVLEDGKVLYLKIHGLMGTVPAATIVDNVLVPGELELLFTIPYTEVYLQGAEIFSDVLCQTDMSVKHPIAGIIEQYGYDVVVGVIKYKRQAQYASRLPQGLQISALLKNVEMTDQEMGVNFVLHEIRDA